MGAAERKTPKNFRCGGGDGEAREICGVRRGGGRGVRIDQVQVVPGVQGAKPLGRSFVEALFGQ